VSANIGQGRKLKVCDLCGGVDDHPRHISAGGGANPTDIVAAPSDEMINKVIDAAPKGDLARLLRDLTDTLTTEHHYDCGRDAGCEFCRIVAAGAKGTGKAMLAHVESAKVDFDDPGIVKAEAL
jgi:hypothetical protein